MNSYKEMKHVLGNDSEGNRAWVNPEHTGRTVALEDRHVDDLNAQFVNTGIKYEKVERESQSAEEIADTIEMIEHIVTQETLDMNPELAEHGIKVGDVLKTAKNAEDDKKLVEAIERETGENINPDPIIEFPEEIIEFPDEPKAEAPAEPQETMNGVPIESSDVKPEELPVITEESQPESENK